MKAFKVVGRYRRYGSNMSAYCYDTFTSPEQVLHRQPSLKPFFPQYKKGSMITAAPGSAGILCFKHYNDALCFRKEYEQLFLIATIILVEGLHEMKPKNMFYGGFNINKFLDCNSVERNKLDYLPTGSIAFYQVLVLT